MMKAVFLMPQEAETLISFIKYTRIFDASTLPLELIWKCVVLYSSKNLAIFNEKIHNIVL